MLCCRTIDSCVLPTADSVGGRETWLAGCGPRGRTSWVAAPGLQSVPVCIKAKLGLCMCQALGGRAQLPSASIRHHSLNRNSPQGSKPQTHGVFQRILVDPGPSLAHVASSPADPRPWSGGSHVPAAAQPQHTLPCWRGSLSNRELRSVASCEMPPSVCASVLQYCNATYAAVVLATSPHLSGWLRNPRTRNRGSPNITCGPAAMHSP